ncbi:hypothetical protein [Caballeronia sp. LZ034LL]|uniref:hypothetical protein n=1 Tax=Caballeronia sp. LZ034LL TaxID=3038567 RepID=UPI00286660FA|nr:hypothetical protein [Caballeronia sp. LZ034LL]MDR5839368.1 hypothetical protein [Caballeronia sp. LZ034LL]
MSNVIPPITDSQGSCWIQPASDQILVSDTDAVMSQITFECLPEYSTSIPSGVYPGKMWRAETEDGWYLRWFGIVEGNPDVCSNNQRKIQIMDWKTLTGVME